MFGIRRVRRALIALGSGIIAGCHTVPPLDHVTHIVVRSSHDSLGAITDSARIDEIVKFVNERRNGWRTPLAGVPVPDIALLFYDGQRARGSFGAGRNFFETQRAGDFFSRGASQEEMATFRSFVAGFQPSK